MGIDPDLADPAMGDFRPRNRSAALSYGCRSFPPSPPEYDIFHPSGELIAEKSGPVEPATPGTHLEVGGYIDVDTTWDAESIHVLGDVKIAPGATLSIAAGARVNFEGHYGFNVAGALQAVGTADHPITFTTANPAAFQPDSSLVASWNGLRFERTSALNPPSRLEHCVIEYAKAVRDSVLVGAVICDDFSNLTVVNTLFRRNVAHWGGALFCIAGSAPTLTGCVMVDNTAFRGGGAVYALDSHPRLLQCTIADNDDLNPVWYRPSAAVLSYMSKPRLEGCVVWGNTTLHEGPAQTWSTKAFYTNWSNIQFGHDGVGNIDLDPLFIAAGLHAYSPDSASPCRDAGPTTPNWRALPAVDPAGRLRLANGRLDMGAYEGASLTDIASSPAAPPVLAARPNPFNPSTELSFTLDHPSDVVLRIHDMRGMLVRDLSRSGLPAGRHVLQWDGSDARGRGLPSGTYVVEITTVEGRDSRLLTLLK